ncbi:mechanosensitive ion channel domain-containing protein [Pelagicoccus sp. SDUM812003]|uniref:mechanosensitive ion channel domain-containing protein n=1 Tax=Pelagicoccus sp. SDUM812003 TaxID=3041267 RepID=UPI00280EE68B|nr:mechanosensitive ion channel domain-containing protein [Pelagicoccus sp. SDUM812003]MDQ8202483.1 mechanosensitive ion channel [Pelagicoccus sp. SDUM812003]
MPELGSFSAYLPIIVTLVVVAVTLLVARWVYEKRDARFGTHSNFSRPILMLCLLAVGIVALIIALPLKDATKDQLLGLFGLVLTGIIALSSTTFVSNAMAGFMIRSIGSFRSGDFVRVGGHFGRVSARGLFHTEIQTEDRDLTTLPNLFLVTNPVTVVRNSGTIISASVSLGYDVHQAKVEGLLIEAAKAAGLKEPFVRVMELGDFSVSYRVAGLLEEVKQLVSKRSDLHIETLNTLHQAGIEILSPSAMMQRPLKDGQRIMPQQDVVAPPSMKRDDSPEERIFDKAEEAEALEKLAFERTRLAKEKETLQSQLSTASEQEKSTIDREIQKLDTEIDRLEAHRKAVEGDEQPSS